MFDESIDVNRMERRLSELGEIGKTDEDGVTCLAYTETENEAFEYVFEEIPDEYDVTVDRVGNVFATPDPNAERSLFVGSHVDSVKNGGRYDGKLGVVTALEAMQTLDESGAVPSVAPTLAVFRAEETARFNVGLIGSRSALGLLEGTHLEATDEDGVSLREAMEALEFRPPTIGQPTTDLDRVAGFIELHIEQGPILDSNDIPVGIATEIRGIFRDRVTVRGLPNHSGATPMEQRQDALAGAAEMIVEIETIGREASANGDIVTTAGDVAVTDASANKVSGEVSFPVDVRSVDSAYRTEVSERIRSQLRSIAAGRNLTVDFETMERIHSVALDERVTDLLSEATRETETDFRRMVSGGGHDVMNFVESGIPAGLVFTACDRGLSHNPNEKVEPEVMRAGTKVLARALLSFRPD